MRSRDARIVSKQSGLACSIQIFQNDDGSQTWSEPAVDPNSTLDIRGSSGTWFYNPNGKYVAFHNEDDDPNMVFLEVPSNFMDGFCTTTFTGDGDILMPGGGASREGITWKIADVCA